MMVLMANVYFHIRRVIVDQAIRKAKMLAMAGFLQDRNNKTHLARIGLSS